MSKEGLKQAVIEALWRQVDALPWVRSATLAGSFAEGAGLDGISDIDFVVVVGQLDGPRFLELQEKLRTGLEDLLASEGYKLRINATLGPLKFNEPDTAVLHLMAYSPQAHRDHAIKSPFTCFDWQRSRLWHRASLAEVYPVFGLQPHHFISARRGARDYLKDLGAGVVTYRELSFENCCNKQTERRKDMTSRDRHEFAYHVMRFIMANFLKMTRRRNELPDDDRLAGAFFGLFPEGADTFTRLYQDLAERKRRLDFSMPADDLLSRTSAFVEAFERQFRDELERDATRHLVFRHAATSLNEQTSGRRRFLGRIDVGISGDFPEEVAVLAAAVEQLRPARAYVSPLKRAIESMALVAQRTSCVPQPVIDDRMQEIAYGEVDGLEVVEGRARHPELFAAWKRGEDPRFPSGENTADVLERLMSFAEERWSGADGPSVTCTHNVVMRCLIGKLLGVPKAEWFKLRVPHLMPVTVIATKRFGLFVDMAEEVERLVFEGCFAG